MMIFLFRKDILYIVFSSIRRMCDFTLNRIMVEINNTTKNKVPVKFLSNIAKNFLKLCKLEDFDVSIAIIGDSEIQKLNKKYRKIDCPTDVLSFEGEEGLLGEIIMDFEQIKRQALEKGVAIKYELAYILIHGLLHLTGYDDEREEDRMEMISIGEKLIKKFVETE
jgi:probable rRNA maturation factor